ncbi:MAG: hypothetical protein ALECFALPRED_009109 [Alectoria fallacina]|uniref:Carrier domain-containing protein n=1 Tax=Alectoria fallacina TaxID=1903189 RepID=A0A8H3PI94_9LECA|nr:MAG: hypothetical protein ALECFALPRED_009109 [Alectoria fallacina]
MSHQNISSHPLTLEDEDVRQQLSAKPGKSARSAATAVKNVHSKEMSQPNDLVIVDDLIHRIAEEDDQVALIAYPAERGLSDYERFSAGRINAFVSNAAEKFIQRGLTWQIGIDGAPSVIGLLGLSSFEYIVTMFALSRLGYTVLILSPRLPAHAYESLLDETRCNTLVISPDLNLAVDQIRQKRQLKSLSIISKNDFEMARSTGRERSGERRKATLSRNTAFIMHSSGSTGLPKCIHLTHAACLHNFSMGYPLECFLTLPVYHMHGHSSLYRAMYQRKTCFIYNASLPLTDINLIPALEAVHPELLLTVPYGLKLLSESESGIKALRNCKMVSFAGSACPDELGDYLSDCGVRLVSTFGLYVFAFDLALGSGADRIRTEAGAVLQSNRRDDDEPWNYLRIIPSVKPYTWMKPVGGGVCELVILDGLKSKIASNSNDPPNSYHTKDLFVAHKKVSDSWKHVGRLDDRVTLVNGEKISTLPIEGRIRQDRRIRETVVFGIGRAIPGLLLFRSHESEHLSDDDFIDAIWAAVEDANSKAESFSQIGREMIIPLPVSRECPQTDKGTVIRARIYEEFAPAISALYEKLGNLGEGTLRLEIEELKRWLLRVFRERLEIHLRDTEEDFFAAGVDSLQATRMLNIIKRELFLNGKNPNTNAVYDTQNIEQLALYLHDLQTGIATENRKDKRIFDVANMIESHSKFDKHISQGSSPGTKSVLLTGATGFLCSYILAQLLKNRSVARIYCPVRASSPTEARDRLLSSLSSRHLSDAHQDDINRIHAIHSDSFPHLASSLLEQEPYCTRLTHIIHCAWPVNFNLPFSTFDDQIHTLHHLLQLSLSTRSPKPAHFIFCSSVSAASFSPSPVPEAPLASFSYAANTGYGCSKSVAEKIIQKAVESAGAKASILRIGQIVGDTLHQSMWNDSDAIPLMVRSALAIGALPALNERCAWLPVDTVARSVVEIAGLCEGGGREEEEEAVQTDAGHECDTPSLLPAPYVFNVVNPHTFAWTETFLPALRAAAPASFAFETLAPETWLRRLRDYNDGEQDAAKKNPSVKLLGFWATKIEPPTTLALVKSEDRSGEEEKVGAGTQTFETGMARGKSLALRGAPDVIAEGYVSVMLEKWLEKWIGGRASM